MYPANRNFGVKHLQQLVDSKPKYLPTINQVDLHPFMTRTELVKFCESHKIVLEVRIASHHLPAYPNAYFGQAWAPLVRGERFAHPSIVRLAEKYKKTPAQILVRYGLERVRRVDILVST